MVRLGKLVAKGASVVGALEAPAVRLPAQHDGAFQRLRPHAWSLTRRSLASMPPAGFQMATNQISEGLGAAEAAAEAGADFVDLNVG